ncbi:MAG: methyl-accepting chemotaxis protein [Lachnospiraceae bacterium]|nr:methyl-accepting chemotaxis protein [Lachnospiraceae bacterium]
MNRDNRKTVLKTGIVMKLVAMSVLPVVLLGIILTVSGQGNLRKGIKKEIYEGLKTAAFAVQGAYDAAGNGDFTMLESGNVIKGMFVVSGNYSLADKLSSKSGTEVSLYYGNKIIVTSLKDSQGGRMMDEAINADIEETVLKKGKEYFSDDIILGNKHYYGYYLPVLNEDSSIAGMVFTGKDSVEVNSALTSDAVRMILLSVVVILVALAFTAVMSLAIARALKHMIKLFGKVADGDLAEWNEGKGIRRSDEIGVMLQGITKLRKSLSDIIKNIQESASILIGSADELEHAAELTSSDSDKLDTAISEISRGAVSQAEETEEAMEDTKHMGEIIGQMVDDISDMAQSASEMGRAGTEASSILSELSEYTEKTTKAVDTIAEQINMTNTSAQEIQRAVEMITAIADETNLLSLNASIEAARAGEQGRGFAVVASQIQKLAEQSAESAQQITYIVGNLLHDAETTAETMEDVVDIVDSQKEKLLQTDAQFETVNRGIQESLFKIGQIRDKSKILDESRKQMANMIMSLSAISEENASASEETASSTAKLNERVKKITQEVTILKKIAADLEQQIQIFKIAG